MYRSILVPTDGSALANKAIKHAGDLAKSTGAQIVIFHAARPAPQPLYTEGLMFKPSPEETRERDKELKAQAARLVEAAVKRAEASGLKVKGDFVVSASPYEAIIAAAKKHHCDLIAMASHGYAGLAAAILGSETQKVLAHTGLPVLVLH